MTKDEALKMCLEYIETDAHERKYVRHAIKEVLAQPKPAVWKLVPIEPTNEMLKAMDECSTEGYDERLLAGHASSVYMAAVDVAPTPPQQKWVGLTDEEIKQMGLSNYIKVVRETEAKLKEKNT